MDWVVNYVIESTLEFFGEENHLKFSREGVLIKVSPFNQGREI